MQNSKLTRIPNLDQLKDLDEVNLKGNAIKNIDILLSSTKFVSMSYFEMDLNVGNDF